MGKFFLWFLVPLVAVVGLLYYVRKTGGNTFGLDQTILSRGSIAITTQSFVNGGEIPVDITCDGQNLSPAFALDRIPSSAKSLVIILDDPDSNPKYFTHWLAFDIGPFTTTIESAKVLGGATIGTNDYGNPEYDGPCPPSDKTHNYTFTIYALDTTLSLDGSARRADLDAALQGHIIATGKISGKYTRLAN